MTVNALHAVITGFASAIVIFILKVLAIGFAFFLFLIKENKERRVVIKNDLNIEARNEIKRFADNHGIFLGELGLGALVFSIGYSYTLISYGIREFRPLILIIFALLLTFCIVLAYMTYRYLKYRKINSSSKERVIGILINTFLGFLIFVTCISASIQVIIYE